MKRKRILIILLIILAGLFTALSSVLINVATSQTISILRLPPSIIWIILGFVTLAGIIVAIFLFHLQANADHEVIIPEIRNRQRMLAKVKTFWINGVLEESLHGAALIVLGLREQRDAVMNPWRLILQQQNHPASSLPTGTHITEVYDNVNGELLILGEPGSGKTTLLLELTRDLLDRAQKDEAHPMPVVFNLSSWAVKRQPLPKWLIEELNAKYQVPRKVGQLWIDTDQLMILLDGLDEIALDYREACIDSINSFRSEHGLVPIVVCSRSTEYLTQTKHLLLHSAVIVQPLTLEQVEDYLISAGEKLTTVREAFHRDKVLHELATTPLMLSVITLAYHGIPVENILLKDSLLTRREQVFATYIQRMLSFRQTEPRYSQQQSIYWLTWLAQQLVTHNQTEFYLERMQLDWLPKNLSYRLYPSIVVGMIYGLGIGLIYGLYFALFLKPNLLNGLVSGILIGLLNWFIFVLLNGLMFERLSNLATKKKSEKVMVHSWESRRQRQITFLKTRLVYGLIFGLLNGILIGWLGTFNNFFIELDAGARLYGEIVFGLFTVILVTLTFGAIGKLDIKIQPAEIVSWSWRSWRYSLVGSLANGLLIGLIYAGLLGLIYQSWVLHISVGSGVGIVFGLLLALDSGLSHEMLNKQNIITPNQGIRSSLRNSFITGLSSGLISGLGFGFTTALGAGLHRGLVIGLCFGLSIGLHFWLRRGGTACILHALLRICLWQANYAPLNYPHFLDFAVEHILLRRVGGGYIFIHRLLLDYFASLDLASMFTEELTQARFAKSF